MNIEPFCGSVALIRHPEELEKRWLVWWDEQRRQFDFVTAERLDGDSFRECIDREIAWTLDIRRGKDYIVSSMARLHLEIPVAKDSDDDHHAIEFFVADLYGRRGREAIIDNDKLHWLTSCEVLDGQTEDGRTINPRLVAWLRQADVIARHSQH